MGKAKAKVKAAAEEEEEEDVEAYDTDAGEGEDDFELERDSTGKLTGVKIVNSFVEAHQNYFLRRYSMVMVQAEGDHKYLGYIRELIEMARDIKALICWFYRVSDLAEAPADLLVCPARLEGRHSGGDKGRFKELFFSNHSDKILVQSVMHPIKVWLLPTDSLDPVTVPPEAGPLAAAAKAAGRGQLLPGFICRRMYNIHMRKLFPLSEVPSMRKQLDGWLLDDVAELIRRNELEREEFMAEWVRKSQERAARGLQGQGQAGKAEADDD